MDLEIMRMSAGCVRISNVSNGTMSSWAGGWGYHNMCYIGKTAEIDLGNEQRNKINVGVGVGAV